MRQPRLVSSGGRGATRRGKANRLRQGYGGPPKLHAKAEGRRAKRVKRVGVGPHAH